MLLPGRFIHVFILLLVSVAAAGGTLGLRSYRVASAAADRAANAASDGPWVRSQSHFVFHVATNGTPNLAPHWLFRFRNPRTTYVSKRVYVTVSGNQVFEYNQFPDADDLRSAVAAERP